MSFPTTFSFSVPASDVILIGIAVALDAIVVFADAFLNVLAANVARCVIVASIAGVTLVVIAYVTGHTENIVVTIKLEIFVVIKSRRHPFFLTVALAAITCNLLMQRVGGRLVAVLALLARFLVKQGMTETALQPEAFYSCMVAMTSQAILTDQLLVERG